MVADPRPQLILQLARHAADQNIYCRDMAFACGVAEKTARTWFSRGRWRRDPSLLHVSIIMDLLGLRLNANLGDTMESVDNGKLGAQADMWIESDDCRRAGVEHGRWQEQK